MSVKEKKNKKKGGKILRNILFCYNFNYEFEGKNNKKHKIFKFMSRT